MSEFVAKLLADAGLTGVISQGQMIVNDYVLTLKETGSEYTITARRGSEVQTLNIPKDSSGAIDEDILRQMVDEYLAENPPAAGKDGVGIISIEIEEV